MVFMLQILSFQSDTVFPSDRVSFPIDQDMFGVIPRYLPTPNLNDLQLPLYLRTQNFYFHEFTDSRSFNTKATLL